MNAGYAGLGGDAGVNVALVTPLDVLLAANRSYLLGWNEGPPAGGDELVTYRSNVPHATLNGVLRIHRLDPKAALAEARRRLARLPRVWWVGPDSDTGAAHDLVALGATELMTMPIMAMDIDDAVTVPVPEGLHIAEAVDLDEYVAAYARVSGIPPEGVGAAVEREKSFPATGTTVRLAGRLGDGGIAGTVTCWVCADVLTLYFVGTGGKYRRRGIGAAMTQAALNVGRSMGVSTAALVSSPMGEPVYRRLGFRTVGHYEVLGF